MCGCSVDSVVVEVVIMAHIIVGRLIVGDGVAYGYSSIQGEPFLEDTTVYHINTNISVCVGCD